MEVYGMDYAEYIKQMVSVKQACDLYGIEYDRSGFARCIVHSEKTPSMKVYNGSGGYYCFGCKAAGDVITFVQTLFGIGFYDALKKLNDDFMLRLPLGGRMSIGQQRQLSRAIYERKKAIEDQKKKREAVENEYWAAFDRWKGITDTIRDYAPTQKNEPWSAEFVKALRNKAEAQENLAYCEYRRMCHE